MPRKSKQAPKRKPRPSDQARFYRRSDGQLVFVYMVEGVVKQLRVPKEIVLKVDAKAWIDQQFKPVVPAPQPTRMAALATLAEQSPSEHERAAARVALEKERSREAARV